MSGIDWEVGGALTEGDESGGWPTADELEDYLLAAGLSVDGIDLAGAVASAILEFEADTRRKILADAEDEEHTETPNAGMDGLIVFADEYASVSALHYYPRNGTDATWTEGTEFEWYRPYAPKWTVIRGIYAHYHTHAFCDGYPHDLNALKITGRRGLFTTIPADIHDAVLLKAAASVLPQIESTALVSAAGIGVTEIKTGDQSIRYGSGSGSSSALSVSASSAYAAAVTRYKRRT
jgi:hypothetical protein